MLGRLFNNRSTDQLNKGVSTNPLLPPHHHNSYSGPSTGNSTPTQIGNSSVMGTEFSAYSNEDSYSRTILYGTPNHLQSYNLETQHFRLVIIHDKGELLMKNNYKVHYDSSIDTHFNRSSNNKLDNKHRTEELTEVMFGNPIHQGLNRSDHFKIHVLSRLPDLKESILVTKHFYVDKKHNFAIGIVIPISLNNISTALLSNWTTIANHLNLFKAIFIENHLMNSKKTSAAMSSNYLDISIFFRTFIKSIKYLSSTPRLLLGLTKFDSVLQNWCFEINNWIEVKDGAKLGFSGTKFLTTLLTIVYGIREQLVNKDHNDEFARVVIMASNPMVAQKLIFIISGLLPFDLDFKVVDYKEVDSLEDTVCESTDGGSSNEMKFDDEHEQKTPPTPSVIKKGWEIPTTPSRSVATPSLMTPCRSSIIQPTSMSNSNSVAYLSSSLSSSSTFSSSLSRGFQLLQNWKNSSVVETNPIVNYSSPSSSSSASYKTPSPNNEYEDYPWNSNLNQVAHPNYTLSSGHHLTRASSSYDLTSGLSNIPKCLKRLSIPKLPHIERTTTTLYKIGESQKSKSQLFNRSRKSCFNLLGSKVSTSIERDNVKNVAILDVSFDDVEDDLDIDGNEDPDDEYNDYVHHTLPQLCGYVNEYIPDFQLQACPISQELDSKIVVSMKNDLNNYARSKTILVSLRAREIKEITLTKKNYEYKSNVKKLYHNSRPGYWIDKENWSKIDTFLGSIVSIFRDHDQQTDDRDFSEVERLLKQL